MQWRSRVTRHGVRPRSASGKPNPLGTNTVNGNAARQILDRTGPTDAQNPERLLGGGDMAPPSRAGTRLGGRTHHPPGSYAPAAGQLLRR